MTCCRSSRRRSGQGVSRKTMLNFVSCLNSTAGRVTPYKQPRMCCFRPAKIWCIKESCTVLPQSICSLALTIFTSKLVQTLDHKGTTAEGTGAADMCIQPAAKTVLSLARKLPPQGTQVPDALQSALEKLRPANYPRIDKHHAAWYPSLPFLLTAWVARGSLAFQDLQLFFAQFKSTLDMPPPNATPTAKPPQESPIVDLTGADNPVISALPLKASE